MLCVNLYFTRRAQSYFAKIAEKSLDITENEISYEIIGASIDIHKEIGPGLLESAYEAALSYELINKGWGITD